MLDQVDHGPKRRHHLRAQRRKVLLDLRGVGDPGHHELAVAFIESLDVDAALVGVRKRTALTFHPYFSPCRRVKRSGEK